MATASVINHNSKKDGIPYRRNTKQGCKMHCDSRPTSNRVQPFPSLWLLHEIETKVAVSPPCYPLSQCRPQNRTQNSQKKVPTICTLVRGFLQVPSGNDQESNKIRFKVVMVEERAYNFDVFKTCGSPSPVPVTLWSTLTGMELTIPKQCTRWQPSFVLMKPLAIPRLIICWRRDETGAIRWNNKIWMNEKTLELYSPIFNGVGLFLHRRFGF
ncbi:hypothetical protein F511_02896 [Dorcoceras hygrometricum]|uniref:Uncharacterized protein n=1 Tax=Dorcoceras hygrometricum TaxID=472368 RepID=A0A2Z7AK45_9LAMI|nr:hypothetical protein F511_02896 [Dorcoceras hygrometricum]